MVYIEPPRSAVVEKQKRLSAEAREGRAQSANVLNSLTTEQRKQIEPFRSSVNDICAHYTKLATANYTSMATKAPSPIESVSANVPAQQRTRPLSANVRNFSNDAPNRDPLPPHPSRPTALTLRKLQTTSSMPHNTVHRIVPIVYPGGPSHDPDHTVTTNTTQTPDPMLDIVSGATSVPALALGSDPLPQRVWSPSPERVLNVAPGTLLHQLHQQARAEATETLSHLKRCYNEYLRDGVCHTDDDGEEEDHMLPLLIDNIHNESMRSAAEQQKSVLGYDPYKNEVVDFTDFAEKNAMLEFIGGQSSDPHGVWAHMLTRKSNTERHTLDVLAHQVSRGFSHKGLEVEKELPIAIIFPCHDEMAANSSDGKRPINRKRFDVHTRCMLVGTLLPPADAWGKPSCLGQLRARHPFGDASTCDPRTLTIETATTVTAEAHYKQGRRREMRDRIRINRSLQKIAAGSSSASGERQVEAAREAQRHLLESSIKPRSNDEILEEVIADRRGYKLSEVVLDTLTEKMRKEAQPLRQLREVKRVKIPDFIEYRDCMVNPSFLVTYEVPNNRIDAPTRSTLDPAALLTTKVSMYDDAQPFERLEYTARWGTPIGSLKSGGFSSDCWVRKVIQVDAAPGDHNASRQADRLGSMPLGLLLQACGRGTVSIDVRGAKQGAAKEPRAPPHYRHSFMFTERGVAAILKDRRYGRNARCLKGPRRGVIAARTQTATNV